MSNFTDIDDLNRIVAALEDRVRHLEAALTPFAARPDVIKYGARSRGVDREYAAYCAVAVELLK